MDKPAYIYDGYNLILDFVTQLKSMHFGDLGFDFQKILSTKITHDYIPKLKHFVWIANKPISTQKWRVIKKFTVQNKNFVTVLWCNMDFDAGNTAMRRLTADANKKNILLIDYKYALAEISRVSRKSFLSSLPYIMGNLLVQRKYVQVADILRIIVLYLFGGVYSDLDLEFKKPIDENFLKTCYGLKINKDIYDVRGDEINHVLFEFDIVAVKPQHPDLYEWLSYLVNAAEEKYVDICLRHERVSTFTPKVQKIIKGYKTNYGRQDYMYAVGTLCKTGPNLNELYDFIAEKSEKIPEDYFKDINYHCGEWSRPLVYTSRKAEKVCLETVVTAIVNELYLEPRILKLNLLLLSPAWISVEKSFGFYRNILKRILSDPKLRPKLMLVEKICYPNEFELDSTLDKSSDKGMYLAATGLDFKIVLMPPEHEVLYKNISDKTIYLYPQTKAENSAREILTDAVTALFLLDGKLNKVEIVLQGVDSIEFEFPVKGEIQKLINYQGHETLIKTVATLCGCSSELYFFTPEVVSLIFGEDSPLKSLAVTQYFLSPNLFDLPSVVELLKFKKFVNEIQMPYLELKKSYDTYGDIISEDKFNAHKKALISLYTKLHQGNDNEHH